MKTLGWIIILLMMTGHLMPSTREYTLPYAIINSVFLISGSALIITDRLKPIVKKGDKGNE